MPYSIITYGFDPAGNHSFVTYGFFSAQDLSLLPPVIDIEVNSTIKRFIYNNSVMDTNIKLNSIITRQLEFRGDL